LSKKEIPICRKKKLQTENTFLLPGKS